MPAGRLVLPEWMPALDNDGVPIASAQIFFYVNRTTTLATVYADQALSVPMANPVLANNAGQFPPIWQDTDFLFSASVEASFGPPGRPVTYDDLQPSTSIGGTANKLDRDGGNYEPELLENVGFQPIDAEAFFRPTVEKLRDIVNAKDAQGFALGGVDDMRAPLEALFAAALEDGGDVMLPAGMINLSGLTIPPGVRVTGAGSRPGEESTIRSYSKLGTILWLDPTGTITLENMAVLENVTILNPKLRYVTVTNGVPDCTEAQALGTAPYTTGPFAGQYAGVAQFSGTAITNNGDDTRVNNVLAIGFNTFYKSATYAIPVPGLPSGPSRPNIYNAWFDCTNGIDVSDCWDIPTVVSPHGWNFFTGHTGFSWAAIKRDGISYNFHDKCDGLMMTNAFTIGWRNSYRFKDIYAAVLTGCTGDGLVEGALSDPTAIGFLTEGTIQGMILNGVRCDANKRNFSFRHVGGMVTGEISSGTTANGIHIELGADSNGVTLDVTFGGQSADGIRIRNAARNWCFKSITVYSVSDIGELIKFDTPTDIQRGSIGFVNREFFGFGVNSYGFRSNDKVVAGGKHPVVVEIDGATDGAAKVAAVGPGPASIDLEARGSLIDGSVVSLTRRTLGGVRQILARFDAGDITPPSFLFRSIATNALRIIAEGAASVINIVIEPKGGGVFQVDGTQFFGTNQTSYGILTGGGANGPEYQADGGATDIPANVVGKGGGGVRMLDLSSGNRYLLARIFRSAPNAPNLAVNCADSSNLVIAAENGGTNVTTAITGKGTGGVRIGMGIYANDAAAAAAGVPLQSLYCTGTGEVRIRLT